MSNNDINDSAKAIGQGEQRTGTIGYEEPTVPVDIAPPLHQLKTVRYGKGIIPRSGLVGGDHPSARPFGHIGLKPYKAMGKFLHNPNVNNHDLLFGNAHPERVNN